MANIERLPIRTWLARDVCISLSMALLIARHMHLCFLATHLHCQLGSLHLPQKGGFAASSAPLLCGRSSLLSAQCMHHSSWALRGQLRHQVPFLLLCMNSRITWCLHIMQDACIHAAIPVVHTCSRAKLSMDPQATLNCAATTEKPCTTPRSLRLHILCYLF